MYSNDFLKTKNKGGYEMTELSGVELFAKYAISPNILGYCGPQGQQGKLFFDISIDLKEKREKGLEIKTEEFKNLSKQFRGATPYLEIIAKAKGIRDIFNMRVVEAYWIGNELLNNVEFNDLYKTLEEKGVMIIPKNNFQILINAEKYILNSKPTHIFHVLNTYIQKIIKFKNSDIILEAIDNCRIKWGIVEGARTDKKLKIINNVVNVRFSFLEFDKYGNLVLEKEMVGEFFAIDKNIKIGDIVSLHYDFVCDILTLEQKSNLEFWTNYHLDIFNSCRDNILL